MIQSANSLVSNAFNREMLRRSAWVAALAVALFSSGCSLPNQGISQKQSTPEWMSAIKSPDKESIDYGKPERMAVIWTDSVATADGAASVRGFGGRVYFYDREGKPIRVDGELSIYAFDESEGEQKPTPDRIYRFAQSDLQSHFGETQLGPSYSVWIPWDKTGGDQKSIALLPMFKTQDNFVVKSEPSLNFLPGKNPPRLNNDPLVPYRVLGSSSSVVTSAERNRKSRPADYGVQLVSNIEPATPPSTAERTTTIDVPRQMTRRMQTDLASATVESVTPGMNAQVSFGPKAHTDASSQSGAQSNLQGPVSANSAAPGGQSVDKTGRSRPVFGAPGALK